MQNLHSQPNAWAGIVLRQECAVFFFYFETLIIKGYAVCLVEQKRKAGNGKGFDIYEWMTMSDIGARKE